MKLSSDAGNYVRGKRESKWYDARHMKSSLYIGLLIAVVAIVGAVAFMKNLPAPVLEEPSTGLQSEAATSSQESENQSVAPVPTTPAETPTTPSAPAGYTMVQVAAHASAESCWTAIAGKVYDLTAWIKKHPGGQGAILRICGKDGTASFEGQHGGDSKPETILASYLLGPLTD